MELTFQTISLSFILILVLGIVVIVCLSFNRSTNNKAMLEDILKKQEHYFNKTASSIEGSSKVSTSNMGVLANSIETLRSSHNQQQENLRRGLSESLHNLQVLEEQKFDNMRDTLDERLKTLEDNNSKKLNEIKSTVDEKLTEHLETTLTKSFQTVSQQLEAVYKSIGEMQSLANGVGDLKKVLSNTKTRGILGEYQLSGILKEVLSEQQYVENVATVPGSNDRVEFAIKFPSSEMETVLLPIDAKFPLETYEHLQNAIEFGNKDAIDACRKDLTIRLKNEAKDIHSKYIHVPDTTEFGILFLPTEGLYAEACNLGMLEVLQRDYRVTIAGPSTMAALLNSFQMGFRTLAIQKRSNEVWKILGKTKTEFGKFEESLNSVQRNLKESTEKLDTLVGTRTRAINRALKDVEVNLVESDDPANLIEFKE